MQSKWRVACVRIPRFPIGAVWRNAIAGDNSFLPHPGQPASNGKDPNTLAAEPRLESGDSRRRIPRETRSSSTGSHQAAHEVRGPESEAGGRTAGPRVTRHESRHWDDLPIALGDGQRIRAVTAAGARAHIRAGMTVTEGTSKCADLLVFPWDQVVVDEEVRRATAAFLDASPQVTPVAGAPGLWWIGASGLEALGGEPALAAALLTIARRWHPGARVAIADSCVAARAGTWETASARRRASGIGHQASPGPDSRFPVPGSRFTIVPPGTDATYLATVPLGLIPMDEAMAGALSALGIRTAGALAALPPDDVEQRWGRTGLAAWHLARGDDRRRPGLTAADFPRSASADLVPGVATMEPVLFLLRAMLERLLAGLVTDGRAAATLAITLTLDDTRGAAGDGPAHTVTREVRLAHPMARLVPLFERCRALLDRWTLPAPVCAVSVAIVATAPLAGEQGDLLDPSWHDPAAADAAFARLRAELGADAIVVPVVVDEHRPERAGGWVAPDGRWETGDGRRPPVPESRVPISDSRSPIPDPPVPSCSRQLETPEPVEVECAGGQPRVLWWRGQRMRIARPLGPERLAGDWWKDGYARDYWRCEDPEGEGTLVLYHDHSSGSAWFVQGWHD